MERGAKPAGHVEQIPLDQHRRHESDPCHRNRRLPFYRPATRVDCDEPWLRIEGEDCSGKSVGVILIVQSDLNVDVADRMRRRHALRDRRRPRAVEPCARRVRSLAEAAP